MAKYNTADREKLAKKGHALPDGSFPIADVEDLKSAIRNWALGKNPAKAKQHIIARAKALGAMNVLPDKWNTSAVSHQDTDEFLAHYGVLGMRWGTRKSRFGLAKQEHNGNHTESVKIKRKKPFQAERNAISVIRTHGKEGDKIAAALTTSGYATLAAGVAYAGIKFGPATLNTIKLAKAASSPQARVGLKAIGNLGKSLPYSKLVKGAYTVTSLR